MMTHVGGTRSPAGRETPLWARRRGAATVAPMADEYCELCDLPRSTCVHGRPAPSPAPAVARPAARPAARPRPAKPATTTRSAPTPPARRAPRRWTPPEALRPHILQVLQEAGGELDAEELFETLEATVADSLLRADHERTPEGELRWRYAARRARQALIAEGLMVNARPGVWQLAAPGPDRG